MRIGNYYIEYIFLIMAAIMIIIPLVADAPLLWIGSIAAVIIGLKKIEPEKGDHYEN